MFIPVQVTFDAEPVLVYPVLQVQTIALLDPSCEQRALTSQAPLFTRQLSIGAKRERKSVSLRCCVEEKVGSDTFANDIGG